MSGCASHCARLGRSSPVAFARAGPTTAPPSTQRPHRRSMTDVIGTGRSARWNERPASMLSFDQPSRIADIAFRSRVERKPRGRDIGPKPNRLTRSGLRLCHRLRDDRTNGPGPSKQRRWRLPRDGCATHRQERPMTEHLSCGRPVTCHEIHTSKDRCAGVSVQAYERSIFARHETSDGRDQA